MFISWVIAMSDESEEKDIKFDGRFQPGNQLWRLVDKTKVGQPRRFASPSQMWDMACAYFEWCNQNPMFEEKAFHSQGTITKTKLFKPQAFTLQGMWSHMTIGKSTWYDYKNKSEYSEVIEQIEQVIYQQKFSGAAVDLFNPNIIARDLGLADKKEVENSGSVGLHEMSDEDLNKLVEENERKLQLSRKD